MVLDSLEYLSKTGLVNTSKFSLGVVPVWVGWGGGWDESCKVKIVSNTTTVKERRHN